MVEHVSLWRRSLGRALIMLTQAVFTRGIGIISSGVLARLLSPSDWGALQAINQTAGTMAQTLKLSIDTGLQIRLSETAHLADDPSEGELLGSALLVLLLLSAASIGIGSFLSEPAARLFGDSALAPFMGWTGWLSAGQLLSQVSAALLAIGAFRTVALTQVGVSCVYLLVLVLAYLGHVRGLWLGLSSQLVLQLAPGVLFVGLTARAFRARGVRPALSRFWLALRALLRLGLPMHAAAAVPALLSLVVTSNLARSTGLPALADLRVVSTMAQLVAFLPSAMAVTFVTELTGARGSDAQVKTTDFLRYIRVVVASAAIAALTAAWSASWLVPLVFGPTYAGSVKLVSLGVATATINATKQALLVGLLSERKAGYALMDSLLSSALYSAIAFVITPMFGVTGILVSDLLGQSLPLLVFGVLLSGRFRTPDTTRRVLLTLLALGLTLSALILTFALHDQPRGTWLTTPLLIGASLSVPWLLFSGTERAQISQMLRARLQRG